MKTIKLALTLTLCAIVALCGCVKDRPDVKSTEESADGSRVIAVSFGTSTKTSLENDGLTPKFQEGDAILVANGKETPAECKVVIENGIAVIHTSLEGELDAVYPASAADVNGYSIKGIRVTPNQTGRFADANICRARIAAKSASATFNNQTAILKFYVDATIGVQTLVIESQEAIADGATRIELSFNDKSCILSDIGTGTSNERICYVAAKVQTYTSLHFTSTTSTQASPVQKTLTKVPLETGKMYNVFLPYYIEVNAGTQDNPNLQKWAYCNIGAFLPEEPGYYFSWGNTRGFFGISYEETENMDWYLPSGEPGPAGGFTEDNYSRTSGAALTSDIPAENDAATAAWGGEWRMPSESEFEVLASLSSEWTAYIGGGQNGRKFGSLFFPAVGRGYNTSLEYQNKKGAYWSSTFAPENPAFFDFTRSNVKVSAVGRYQGMPIRPIYGSSAPEVLPEVLSGVFTVGPGEDKSFGTEDDVKVNFLRGNLWWKESDNSWHIEDQQYDAPETFTREHLGLFYYFADATKSNYGTKDITKIEDTHTEENLYENYGAKDESHDFYAPNADWGVPYGKGHTLTYDEWGYLLSFDKNKSQYLLDDHPDEGDMALATDYSNDIRTGRYKEKVEVLGHIGMLLVPDNWDLQKMPLKTSYSGTEWKTAQAAGAVFLPYVYGNPTNGTMLMLPSQEYYAMYQEMVKEELAKNPEAKIPEYSDLIMPYFFCQGLFKNEFVILTNMLTGGDAVMLRWYNWDMTSSMRLVEYVK